jgi:hypothetical protein
MIPEKEENFKYYSDLKGFRWQSLMIKKVSCDAVLVWICNIRAKLAL